MRGSSTVEHRGKKKPRTRGRAGASGSSYGGTCGGRGYGAATRRLGPDRAKFATPAWKDGEERGAGLTDFLVGLPQLGNAGFSPL